MRAGVAGPVEVFVLLGPHHRGDPARGATGHRLALDERVTVGREDRRRVVRRRAVRISGPGPGDDKVSRDRCGKQDTALGVAAAPATPSVVVLPHIRDRGVRGEDEDVDIARHPGGRGLLDVRRDVDGIRADRQIPDAVAGERPEGRDAARDEDGVRRNRCIGMSLRAGGQRRQRTREEKPSQDECQADPGAPASARPNVRRKADAGGPGVQDRGHHQGRPGNSGMHI